MERRVTTIPATRFISQEPDRQEAKKVAAYARVSTDNEEQLTSYNAQVSYYSEYIKANAEWDFAGVYTDEGISGTSTKNRDGFNSMIADAMNGRIDLILTKSVSRFARNTVDTLTTVRKLRDRGVEVYFEKENIHTLDAKGELLITIMSSLAQEESRSISENVKWGQRKGYADGKVSLGYSRFLGYDKGPDGTLVVNEEQAKTVKLIYKLYLSGLSLKAIGEELMNRGLKSPSGKEKWHKNTIMSILTNEKYKGDALLQKTYSTDFLSKKRIKNRGEVQQYYVENDHEAIIEPEMYDLVQREIARRAEGGNKFSSSNIFSGRIKCGCCGSWFGAKVWHSNDKYRKVIYQCNRKYNKACPAPNIEENEIKEGFIKAINKLLKNKDEIMANLEMALERISDCVIFNRRKQELFSLMEHCMEEISGDTNYITSPEQYMKKEKLTRDYEDARTELEEIEEKIKQRSSHGKMIKELLRTIQAAGGGINSFDRELWTSLVDHVVVDGKIKYYFKDGSRI
ncbi:Phage integrase (Site-specific recombinase) [Anaerovibrio sp. JC8]|uniref:recombinase family protein n=1 Tax=Anaerovibrio sp. JC8 TaxID=1240085 RepID=UPI000A09883B|nr:recombinase family protein [Anaerovibrio sp. JC8]ORU01507.1 Phage integrase (Site-specific recombinase) [Anaerovibrio sp. JC8]